MLRRLKQLFKIHITFSDHQVHLVIVHVRCVLVHRRLDSFIGRQNTLELIATRMLKCLENLDLPNESSRPLIITEDVLEALTRVVFLG